MNFGYKHAMIGNFGLFLITIYLLGSLVMVSVGTKWRFSDAGRACSGEGDYLDETFLSTCTEGGGCYTINETTSEKAYLGLMYSSGSFMKIMLVVHWVIIGVVSLLLILNWI